MKEKQHDYEDLRRLYAEISVELARHGLMEAALKRGRQAIASQHERGASRLAPFVAYPEHAETYLEEAEGWWKAQGAD